jgi:hypothetical protein
LELAFPSEVYEEDTLAIASIGLLFNRSQRTRRWLLVKTIEIEKAAGMNKRGCRRKFVSQA